MKVKTKTHRLFTVVAIATAGSMLSVVGVAPANAAPTSQSTQSTQSTQVQTAQVTPATANPAPSVNSNVQGQNTVTTEMTRQPMCGFLCGVLVGIVVEIVNNAIKPKPVTTCKTVTTHGRDSKGQPVSTSTTVCTTS